jgi:hypothetical protein
MKKIVLFLLIVMAGISVLSCSDDFLDKKPVKSVVVPNTLSDFQALLDNPQQVMNRVPALGFLASDEAFTSDAGYLAFPSITNRNSYIWAVNIYEGEQVPDWMYPYQQVFYANIILEGLEKIKMTTSNEADYKRVKGSALFFRGHAFYQLAQFFADFYEEGSASQKLGIPLRRIADVNAPVTRANLAETYDQIINDLTTSLQYLPPVSKYKTRPSSVAAKALLARLYLSMEKYKEAEAYATMSLEESSFLLDYNHLNTASLRPIPQMNDEILFYAELVSYRYTTNAATFADTLLYASFDNDDLRKAIFFRQREPNRFNFKGTYTANTYMFGGIANDEVYLTRAECRVRNNNINGALEDINTLLSMRWKSGTFSPITESDPSVVLSVILKEREKELMFRSTRWTDLRRLNKDTRFAKTLHKFVLGNQYSLPPNDLRYTYPIPDQEIQLTGIPQNVRQ